MSFRSSNNLKQLSLGTYSHSNAPKQRSLKALIARGVSYEGARQFLDGEVVVGPADRQRIFGIFSDLVAPQATSAIALLVPAVQKAPEAARRDPPPHSGWVINILPYMEQSSLWPASRQQFATGLPVTDANDRAELAKLMIDTLERSGPVHPGGVQVLMGDGSVR